MIKGCFEYFSRKFQVYLRELKETFKGVSRLLQACSKYISEEFEASTEVFRKQKFMMISLMNLLLQLSNFPLMAE